MSVTGIDVNEYKNVIKKLPNKPTQKGDQLQELFDKTPNKCVDVINDIVSELNGTTELTIEDIDNLWENA